MSPTLITSKPKAWWLIITNEMYRLQARIDFAAATMFPFVVCRSYGCQVHHLPRRHPSTCSITRKSLIWRSLPNSIHPPLSRRCDGWVYEGHCCLGSSDHAVPMSGAPIVGCKSGQSKLRAGWKVYHPSDDNIHQPEGLLAWLECCHSAHGIVVGKVGNGFGAAAATSCKYSIHRAVAGQGKVGAMVN